ncbi:MAG TPA: SMC-Scp complex subunit ScpB [Sporichthyaceae bacterium]|jgi:segregation and condensation protein B|nr:SMC-Scp complex subunit ScpB [Sporichthyaceae bacterium]
MSGSVIDEVLFGSRAVVAVDEPAPSDAADGLPALRCAVEAVLLVVDSPVTEVALAQACECGPGQVLDVLTALAAEYAAGNRGMTLRQVSGGWRLYSNAACAEIVERFVRDGQQARLTQAALETLAVVAYRQPVSRSRVSAVRGVNVDGVMRTLLARGLVQEAGTDSEFGAMQYRTTSYFLDRLGLNSLDDLPELAPFLPEIAALEGDTELPAN